MDRVIGHVDADSFYATVEELYRPPIRGMPIAVCGDQDMRHGIVLTANRIAKKTGVKVGMPIWQAKQQCPQIVIVPANPPLYDHFSGLIHELCSDYTDQVEAFGIDERWIDVSAPGLTVEKAARIADEIRARAVRELGITLSVGMSFCKIFAKLGSDLNKPNGTTIISPENYQQVVWPLPVNELLYVGPSRTKELVKYGIRTIGQLANADLDVLQYKFGKVGVMLKGFALGLDSSRVMRVEYEPEIKSVSHSITTPHDIATLDDAKCAFYIVAEAVAARMRETGFRTRCVSIHVRRTDLSGDGCQRTIPITNITSEIAEMAYRLFCERYTRHLPLRSVGLSCGSLVPASAPEQLCLFDDPGREKQERLDTALDGLRQRFGHQIVRRGIVMFDKKFSVLNPKELQTNHPVGYMAI